MDNTERMRILIAPLVAETDAHLYDLEFDSGVLRVTVDSEGGVDMGVIGSLTRSISRMIDEQDPIPGQFTLEVSSPGLERPLRTPEHFSRAIGEKVNVKARAGVDGDRRFQATVVAVDADGVIFDNERSLGFDQVERARTVFDWGPAPKPGSGSKPGSKSAGTSPAKSAPSAKKNKKAAKS